MKRLSKWLLALALCAAAAPARALVLTDAGGNAISVQGLYYLNGSGVAVPVAPGTPLPTVDANGAAINSQTQALSVAPTISGVTSVTSSAVSTVFTPATRNFFRLANNNTATGSDLGCTDDGSTPTATHWDIKVFANTFYEATRPGFVSNQAIQCIGITGTVTFVGEAY